VLADRWQQSFQQQFITVVAAISLCASVYEHQQPSFQTATDTISDLLKVKWVRKS